MDSIRLHCVIYLLLTVMYHMFTQCYSAPSSSASTDEIAQLFNLLPMGGSVSSEGSDAALTSSISVDKPVLLSEPEQDQMSTEQTRQTTEDSLGDIKSDIEDYDSLTVDEPALLIQTNKDAAKPFNFTKMHEEAIELRKAQIKNAIKNKLRLKELPVVDPSVMSKRYPHHILLGGDAMQNDETPPPVDTYHAKTHTLLRFPQAVPDVKTPQIASELVHKTIFVPLPLSVSKETLKKATLFVYLATPSYAIGEKVLVQVKTNRPTKKNILHRDYVQLQHRPEGHWLRIDVTDECKAWLRNEWFNNLGLTATALLNGVDLINYTSSDPVNNQTVDRLPFIKLELSEYDAGMKKRSFDNLPLSCEPDDKEQRCCRYNFVLDFNELGHEFDFIISPKRYYANYCAGSCPEYHLPSMPYTTGMRRRVQRCCTPALMSPLMLLYQDDNNGITQSELPGMSISSCGCD